MGGCTESVRGVRRHGRFADQAKENGGEVGPAEPPPGTCKRWRASCGPRRDGGVSKQVAGQARPRGEKYCLTSLGHPASTTREAWVSGRKP